MGLQWTNPSDGLFNADEQSYFWQCLMWFISQAAPLLMIMFAAAVVALVIWMVKMAVTSVHAEDGEYIEEDDD